MQDKIQQFRDYVIEASANPEFVHHKWFVKWHLEIVDRLTKESLESYPEADKELVEVMVWLHDYGKILNFENSYQTTLEAGRKKLAEIGFPKEFIEKAVSYIDTLDKKLEVDLHEAPIEVQIVSSADGCSHMVGPFLYIFWHEATDKTFTDKTLGELMELTIKKVEKDWSRKIVLPEVRKVFEARYKLVLEQNGSLPEKFIN
jgi:hypothetical protein